MNERIDTPAYIKIAFDVAGRIYRGEFKEGQKIHGRSVLASEYNVSPETIRRAMALLNDLEVITISQGSGIFIMSRQNAETFLKRFEDRETINKLRNEIIDHMMQKKSLESMINHKLQEIIDYSTKLKAINPLDPVEVEIPRGCPLIGKTISESKFWQITGGTIIGIRRKDAILISPGPYAGFEEGDIIVVVGDTGLLERLKNCLAGRP